jgi:hypothetical protein
MKKIFLILFFLISLPVLAVENKENDMSEIIGMMVVAKATGMCGVFSQMVSFQQSTKMSGGDEFIVRFLTTEAVRLGYTLDSFMAQCPSVVEKYNANMEMLGFDQ